MKSSFISWSLDLIQKNKEISELDEKKLRYGLEGFYNVATKTIVFLLLAIIFDVVPEYLVLTVVYSTLRLYGFGIHMKTSLQCWITSLPMYIGGCLLVKYVVIPKNILMCIWIIGYLSFMLFAPADTPSRPLIRKNKRIRAKILSIIILSIYFVVFLNSNNQILNNLILYSVIMESFAINPITYKLFHTSFNNYKQYQENMV